MFQVMVKIDIPSCYEQLQLLPGVLSVKIPLTVRYCNEGTQKLYLTFDFYYFTGRTNMNNKIITSPYIYFIITEAVVWSIIGACMNCVKLRFAPSWCNDTAT